jgi:hypothetical protein
MAKGTSYSAFSFFLPNLFFKSTGIRTFWIRAIEMRLRDLLEAGQFVFLTQYLCHHLPTSPPVLHRLSLTLSPNLRISAHTTS